MITTKTGAFYPAIPPYYAAAKLHGVKINDDPLTSIDPQTCNLPQENSADFAKMLNLFWQVKTFDAIIEWDFATPPTIEEGEVTYFPSQTGQQTLADIPLIDPKLEIDPDADPEEPPPPVPTNPWRDIALGLVVGNVEFWYGTEPNPQNPTGPQIPSNPWRDIAFGIEVPPEKLFGPSYPEDRDEARALVRTQYSFNTGPGVAFSIESTNEFPVERAELVSDFNFYFSDWTNRTQTLLNSLQSKTGPAAEKWIAELTRILEAIPDIKTRFEDDYLTPRLQNLDSAYALQNNTDYQNLLASEAKSLSFQFQQAVTREEDLELFELFKGFEQRFLFLPWHHQRRFGVECLPTQRGFDSTAAKFPCGFYFDEVQKKYHAAIQLYHSSLNFGWITESVIPYTANTNTGAGTVQRFARKSLQLSTTLIGTDLQRVRNQEINFFADGEVAGGIFTDTNGQTYEYSAGYATVYNQKGEDIAQGTPPDFEDLAEGSEEFVYSGLYFADKTFDGVKDFFTDVVTAIQSAHAADLEQIGVFKFKATDDSVIYETPIYGNPFIWTKFDITYKVKSRWDDPAPE